MPTLAPPRLADFYIIGGMKCGTSTLHDQLARRSRFFLTTPKEPNFFSDDQAYSRGLFPYVQLFADARPDQIWGESSTHYTKLPTFSQVPERIKRHTPDARFVYVMREPMGRLISQYMHEWRMHEVEGGFEEAVARHERFVAYSCYYRQLKAFLDHFEPNRFLLVFFEYLVKHPEQELERVARFLGDDSNEPFVWHEDIAAQNVAAERMRNSKWRDALVETKIGTKIKEALTPELKETLKSFWKMKKRPQPSPETEKRLKAILDADLQQLGELLDLPLRCDTYKSIASSTVPILKKTPTRSEAPAAAS